MGLTTAPGRLPRAAVFAAAGLTIMAPALIAPSLPAMAAHYGDETLVRLVLTVTSLAIAISAPFAGALADRRGRRPVLIGGLLLYAASGTAGLVVTDLGALLGTRAALGIAVAAVTTAVTALLTDWFTGPRRATYLGYQQGAASLGGVLLLPAAGLLADVGWRAPFWLYAVAAPVAVLALATVRDTGRDPGRDPGPASASVVRAAANPARWRVLGLYLLALAATAVFYMAPTQLPFLLGGLGVDPTLAGVAIAGSTLSGLVGSLAFPAVRRRLSPTAVTLTGLVALGAGWALVGIAQDLVLVLAGMLVGGLGVGLTVPNLNLRLGELAQPAQRGRVLAGLVTGIFLGQFLSPVAAAPLVAATGLGDAFLWAGLLAVAGPAVAAPLLLRRRRRRTDHTRPTAPPHLEGKSMIIHGNRFTIKPGTSPERLEEALESLRNQGRVIPSVKSFVVGRDYGGEYEWGATFVIEDLEGYWEYLTHPAHRNTDSVGLPLVDKFASFDITDDPDPDMGARIAELHQRRYDGDPELTQLISDLGEYTGSAAPGKHGES